MNSEIFGVFGSKSDFEKLRPSTDFDRVIAGNSIVIGIRDPALDSAGRTATHVNQSSSEFCVMYGEVFSRHSTPQKLKQQTIATTVYNSFVDRSFEALGLNQLNGSYLAVLDINDEAIVATDPINSRECFYTDTTEGRVFGTDLSQMVRARRLSGEEIRLNQQSICEFLQFGVVFGDRTAVTNINRIPFDGYCTSVATHELSRFVYNFQEFDFISALADRLGRAIRQRGELFQKQADRYPETKTGLLLSAGFDSRVILAALPFGTVDECYTVGMPETAEVRVAQKLATQYGSDHMTLPVTTEYLDISPNTMKYTNGIRESIHIHHSSHQKSITTDRIFHGLFLDTLLRDRYLPRETLSVPVLGCEFPLSKLEEDPDIPKLFAKTLGFESGERLLDGSAIHPQIQSKIDQGQYTEVDPEHYLRDTIIREYKDGFTRTNSPYNAASLLGIKCKSALPFRSQLADQHIESLIAADAGLIEWHLQTPPEYRTDRTYQAALKQIEPNIFRYRPPDRPHQSYQANQVEKYLRKTVPGLPSFGTPWPDRDQMYSEANIDREFKTRPDLQNLSTRAKLRIRDLYHWIESIEIDSDC